MWKGPLRDHGVQSQAPGTETSSPQGDLALALAGWDSLEPKLTAGRRGWGGQGEKETNTYLATCAGRLAQVRTHVG